MEEGSGNPKKRPWEEEAAEAEEGAGDPPLRRRIAAAEDILGVLDDDDGAAAAAAAAELASVMRSLEAEIALPAHPRDDPDLGFLFAASDDELGLPPPRSPPPPPPPLDGGDSAAEGGGGGFGDIWGFEEETYPAENEGVWGGEGFEGFGGGDDDDDDEEMVVGLFEWSDVMMSCGPSDLADVSWRSESLPAV